MIACFLFQKLHSVYNVPLSNFISRLKCMLFIGTMAPPSCYLLTHLLINVLLSMLEKKVFVLKLIAIFGC